MSEESRQELEDGLRRLMGDSFYERLVNDGRMSFLYGFKVGTMTRDDLYATIGFLSLQVDDVRQRLELLHNVFI